MRLYHDASSNRLIIKFVKTGHNIAARQFLAELMEGCQAVGITRKDFYAIGSGRHECATNRSKEPDESFKQRATRPYYDDKPTLAVEIDFSARLKQLRNDADFWLTHTNRQVKVVILIHINRDNKSLHIEQWQMQSTYRPAKAQNFDIVSNNGAISVQPEVPLRISMTFCLT
ncbi:hypothetical protein SI65_02972 [Aspergillus cristatus]|uniref:Uncharacterized protein n=1 Tax=Aspergillus cristatus TaxID=573508 RepID=A0A1E3BP14_ASPCR|nr:hypothetical protein SI65_02972 [Aspergillus cristatus]